MTPAPPPPLPLPPLLRDQRKVDANHLKLLGIFHLVRAGFSFLWLFFLLLHFTMMRMVFMNPEFWNQEKAPPPPEFLLSIMMVFYGIFGVLIVLSLAANVASGICLLRRRGRIFCMVVAGFNCLSVPLGTVLGVFTFIVLLRDSVQELFAAASSAAPPVE